MGLRVRTNIAAMEALRNLTRVDRNQTQNLERLSTGLRINRASDDPSGLVISEQLRAQTASMKQAVQNTQTAKNLIDTTEAALNEVNTLLIGIRESIIFAMNTANDTNAIEAKQRSVDQAISAIDRIAVTTRFGNRDLLNGASDFQVRSKSSYIDDLTVRSVRFANNQSSVVFTVKVNRLASRALIKIASGGSPTDVKGQAGRVSSGTVIVSNAAAGTLSSGQSVTLRITGSLGSEDIKLASGATIRDLITAVNGVSNSTGVFASSASVGSTPGGIAAGTAGFSFALYSTDFGSKHTISVENLTTSGSNVALVRAFQTSNAGFHGSSEIVSQGFYFADSGRDLDARVDGAIVVSDGYNVRVTSNFLDADLDISQRVYNIASNSDTQGIQASTITSNGVYFRVLNNSSSGLKFQLNAQSTSVDRIQIGIQSIRSSELGKEIEVESQNASDASNLASKTGGFLASLRSGAGNDLIENPDNALTIVDAALDEINQLRSFLGSISKDTLDPALSSLNVAISNITATESSIRDLDFAAETTEFTKNQILFQAATSVLASANLIPQSVLSLLG
ncbi:MAG: flagellin [Planctomycetes bacterium]|nr:flagellin [Planctomycetota bacterium]